MAELIYKAIGDSLTKGVGTFFSKGFVGKYAQHVMDNLHHPIRTEIIGTNKIMSRDLLYQIQDEPIQLRLMTGNIFTITIGGNDLLNANKIFNETLNPMIFEESYYEFKDNMTNIIREIEYIKSFYPSPYFIRLIGLYNPFPQVKYTHYWVNRFNEFLQSFHSNHIKYVHIYTPFLLFGDQLICFDQIHPNRYGYQLIADETARLGFYPFK